jgi:hypothetical protein
MSHLDSSYSHRHSSAAVRTPKSNNLLLCPKDST